MKPRTLLALALGLALGAASAAAQASGDPDYEPDRDTVVEYERLGEEASSDYALDDGAFYEVAGRSAAKPPSVVPPSGAEVEKFRTGLTSAGSIRLVGATPSRPGRAKRPPGSPTTTTTNSAT